MDECGDTQSCAPEVEFALTRKARLKGLLRAPVHDRWMVLAPCCDIHTIGMKYALDVAFVSRRGVVLTAFRNVGPNRRLRNRAAALVIERFADPGRAWLVPGESISIARICADQKIERERNQERNQKGFQL